MSVAMTDVPLLLKDVEPELAYHFEEMKLHPDIQAKIASEGFGELQMFAMIDEGAGQAGARTFARDKFGIVSSSGGAARTAAARVVLAWEAANKRIATKVEVDAHQRTSDGPKVMLKNEYANAIKSLNDRRSLQPERLQSSQSYLESRLEQIEDGMLIAENWSEVTSVEEDKQVGAGALQVGRDGRLKMTRGVSHAAIPRNPEE